MNLSYFMLLLISLISPILLMPIEFFLPYPHIIEEIFKLALILLVVKTNRDNYYKKICLLAIVFSVSESLFYLTNFLINGMIYFYIIRFCSTILLHTTTILVIGYFAKKRNYLSLVGLIFATIIHYCFNQYIPAILNILN